jgi:pimeloyl-ACP methyl ester carboxylesterase
MSSMDYPYARIMGRSSYLRTHATGYIDTGGCLIHNIRTGAGRPVILVHGGGMWLYSYRHLLEPLSQTHEVHAIDMPGYGYTVIRDSPVTMGTEYMISALKGYLDARGIGRSSFVGHSWGGGWVLAFAQAFRTWLTGSFSSIPAASTYPMCSSGNS